MIARRLAHAAFVVHVVVVASACGNAATPPATPPPVPSPKAEAVAVAPASGLAAAGAPEVLADPVLAPLADAPCVIRDSGASPIETPSLRVGGNVFARPRGGSMSIDVRLRAGDAGGTATIETDEVALTGEVQLADVDVRPRANDLREGYVRVRSAHLATVTGDAATLSLELPAMVKPKVPPAPSIACRELTPLEPPPRTRDARVGKPVTLKEGVTVPLRTAPAGPIVADVVTPKKLETPGSLPGGREATELERRAGGVRLLIEGDTTDVEGWVPIAALDPTSAGYGYGTGSGHGLGAPVQLRCAHDVPVFVRNGADVVRVGVVKANAPLRRVAPDAKDEIVIDLDAARRTGRRPAARSQGELAVPFVRASTITDCSERR